MRGSVYYQTAQLAKHIFVEGAKKYEKTDSNHPHYKCISSFKTMETYRKVWDNFGNYLKEHWKLNDFEQITNEHVDAYISYKIEYYPSGQYLKKIVSGLGKLQDALERFTLNIYGQKRTYDFSIRQDMLHYAKAQNLVADGYHDRVYKNPQLIIDSLEQYEHRLAAQIQLNGGARSEGVTLIKKEQLLGQRYDEITKTTVGVIETREKGGKVGDVLLLISNYESLEKHIEEKNIFRIKYREYADDIRKTCLKLNMDTHGSHGFRWTFAQRRVREYQVAGYSYEQALQAVSWEMKHHRAMITEHYLGG